MKTVPLCYGISIAMALLFRNKATKNDDNDDHIFGPKCVWPRRMMDGVYACILSDTQYCCTEKRANSGICTVTLLWDLHSPTIMGVAFLPGLLLWVYDVSTQQPTNIYRLKILE